MSSGYDPCPEHSTPTRRGKRYCFYDKHHRRGVTEPAQWDPDLGRDEEFGIFDEADWEEIQDEDRNLYGLRRSPEGRLLSLGAGGEQIAKFWNPSEGTPWHGFPLLPLASGTRAAPGVRH